MIKYILAILLAFSLGNVEAIEADKEKLIKNILYSKYCFHRKSVKHLLDKDLIPEAVSKLKGAKHQAYIKALEEKTTLYRIDKLHYHEYDKEKVHCSVVFSLKPNKQQEKVDVFYGKFYIIIEELIKNHVI